MNRGGKEYKADGEAPFSERPLKRTRNKTSVFKLPGPKGRSFDLLWPSKEQRPSDSDGKNIVENSSTHTITTTEIKEDSIFTSGYFVKVRFQQSAGLVQGVGTTLLTQAQTKMFTRNREKKMRLNNLC